MRNVDEAADEIGVSRFDALPEHVREALGELAGAAKEGLMALSVAAGLGVLHELMAAEVVGAKERHNADRRAKRHGHDETSVTLGARRGQPPSDAHRRGPPLGQARDVLPLRRA